MGRSHIKYFSHVDRATQEKVVVLHSKGNVKKVLGLTDRSDALADSVTSYAQSLICHSIFYNSGSQPWATQMFLDCNSQES